MYLVAGLADSMRPKDVWTRWGLVTMSSKHLFLLHLVIARVWDAIVIKCTFSLRVADL